MGTFQEKLTYKSYSLSFNHILDNQLIYSSVAQKKRNILKATQYLWMAFLRHQNGYLSQVVRQGL